MVSFDAIADYFFQRRKQELYSDTNSFNVNYTAELASAQREEREEKQKKATKNALIRQHLTVKVSFLVVRL